MNQPAVVNEDEEGSDQEHVQQALLKSGQTIPDLKIKEIRISFLCFIGQVTSLLHSDFTDYKYDNKEMTII